MRAFALRVGDGPVTLIDAGIGPADSPAASWAPVPGRLPAELAAVESINSELPAGLIAPLRAAGQLRVVDGDTTLTPGVRLLPTPGHTPGHQCVLVDTGDERVLFTGDLLVHVCSWSTRNWRTPTMLTPPRPPLPHHPPARPRRHHPSPHPTPPRSPRPPQ